MNPGKFARIKDAVKTVNRDMVETVMGVSAGRWAAMFSALLGLLLIEPYVLSWAHVAGWAGGGVAVGALLGAFMTMYLALGAAAARCERFIRGRNRRNC